MYGVVTLREPRRKELRLIQWGRDVERKPEGDAMCEKKTFNIVYIYGFLTRGDSQSFWPAVVIGRI